MFVQDGKSGRGLAHGDEFLGPLEKIISALPSSVSDERLP